MIDIAVFSEHNLMLQSISRLLTSNSEFRVVLTCNDRSVLTEKLKLIKANVLVFTMLGNSVRNLNLIAQLKIINPGMRILVVSVSESDEMVLSYIKAGAKGFLGKESAVSDLIEAIFTIRNGYDYFSKSITQIVLNKYINSLKDSKPGQQNELNQLSARQIEILKLMGKSLSNQEIAEKLFISVRTVETHKNHIMQKLNLRTSVDMIKFGIRNNIIEI
jgi:two-component system response regulator NreC